MFFLITLKENIDYKLLQSQDFTMYVEFLIGSKT